MTMVENLLSEMCLEPGHISHDQPEHINSYLKPMIQRDFISLLPDHVAENILYYLDADSLKNAELVSTEWFRVISEGMLWKKLIERKVRTDALWRVLAERRQWIQYLFKPRQGENHSTHSFYRSLYHEIIRDVDSIDSNWRNGDYISHGVYCRPVSYKGFYSLQYDDQKIVSGHCDNSIIIWDRKTLQRTKELIGHTGSVMHLQYDDKVIISGSCDCTVRVWNVNTGEMINTLFHHNKAVRHLKFNNGMLVTCSRDRSIAVWDMTTQSKITLRRAMVGHTAAVNMVDFDEKYIVSASDDMTIKVWSTSSCELVRTLNGHKHRITCFQYKDRLVVSGSADIRLWDIESGTCLRVINAHKTALVRSICFDSKRIITGAYNGKIKVWDLVAALDPQAPTSSLCLRTLVKHTDCVYRLQMNEYQIKSSSCYQIILTWDFLAASLSTVCTQQSSSSEYSD